MRLLRWLKALFAPSPSPLPIPSVPQVTRTVTMEPLQFSLDLSPLTEEYPDR